MPREDLMAREDLAVYCAALLAGEPVAEALLREWAALLAECDVENFLADCLESDEAASALAVLSPTDVVKLVRRVHSVLREELSSRNAGRN
jgi:hypothetical protein